LTLPAPVPVSVVASIIDLHTPTGPAWLFFGVGAALVLGPVVATRLRLPGIIGLLLGGLVIGPQMLGIVSATDTTVKALGQLGLLYLMFTAGAELDLALFRQYRRAAATFGLLTFGFPMALGFASGQLLDYSFAASLLLGSLWASHTLVTYPMVRQAGLSGNRAVATTVGATVITDTLSLVVLAGVAGSVTGSSSPVEVVVSLAIGLVALGAYAGVLLPRITRWFFTHLGHGRDERYAFLLAAMLSCAVLAEIVGIEGIVGAFFAGLGLNRLIPAGSALMERVEFFGSAVLVPVFLVSVGVLIKPAVVADPSTLGLAAVFCVAVIVGKTLAAITAKRTLGFTGHEAAVMFGLSTSQAAATLAATFVGFDVGLFGEQVVNAVLVVILVSLLLSSVVTARALVGLEPTPLAAVGLGRKVVLVAGREDRLSGLARLAQGLAEREGGVVVPVRIGRRADDVEGGRSLLGLAEEALSHVGVDAEARLRVDDDPIGAVAATALEEEGTVVVMDWQAASRPQPALRGERDDVLLGVAAAPVVLATMSDAPFRRVVLALDRADLAPACAPDVRLAIDVAARLGVGDVARLLLAPADELPPELADALTALGPVERDERQEDRTSWVADAARPGDLVVLPAHPDWSTFGPAAVLASARSGVSVVVVADPQRWATSAAKLGALVPPATSAPPTRWP
jgi:Kef-type K+ transport system membrane component KefB